MRVRALSVAILASAVGSFLCLAPVVCSARLCAASFRQQPVGEDHRRGTARKGRSLSAASATTATVVVAGARTTAGSAARQRRENRPAAAAVAAAVNSNAEATRDKSWPSIQSSARKRDARNEAHREEQEDIWCASRWVSTIVVDSRARSKMSCQRNAGKITVPDDLRDVLLEFTISYLLEQPGDIIDYAVDFFTRLRDARQTQLIQPDTQTSTPDESVDEEPPVSRFATRRKSVFAETYNPEEDEEDDGFKMVHPKSDEQRQRLGESVKNILLFRALDEEQMADVLDAMFEKIVQPGEFIIRQGDDGDNFYVIERGKFEVYVKDPAGVDSLIHTYDNRGAFGELALLYNMPRAATVKTIAPGTLWAMDRQTFRRILLKSAYKKRKMYEDLINKVPMLKSLESYERMNLADALVPKHYSDGEQIIRQGDTADGMYFVEDGVVRITILGENGREIEINRVPAGGYLGELALVTHKPRAASAYAVGDIKLAFLDVEAFERLLGPCMELMKRNIDDYEDQLVKIFGSKNNISDIR